MALLRAAKVTDISEGRGKLVTLAGRKLALFRVGASFYAIEGICPHRGAPLWTGEIEGYQVIRPLHEARFDVRTGSHLCPPAMTGVASFPVQVIGSDLYVDPA